MYIFSYCVYFLGDIGFLSYAVNSNLNEVVCIYVRRIHFVLFSFHLVARAKACLSDYRAALQNEKSAYSVYKSKVSGITAQAIRAVSLPVFEMFNRFKVVCRCVDSSSWSKCGGLGSATHFDHVMT